MFSFEIVPVLQLCRGDCRGMPTLMFRQACADGVLVALHSTGSKGQFAQTQVCHPLQIATPAQPINYYSAVLKICAIGESEFRIKVFFPLPSRDAFAASRERTKV